LQRDPPAGDVLDSDPRRSGVVHDATADMKLRRITDMVEAVLD
jgi:hypothetical protein